MRQRLSQTLISEGGEAAELCAIKYRTKAYVAHIPRGIRKECVARRNSGSARSILRGAACLLSVRTSTPAARRSRHPPRRPRHGTECRISPCSLWKIPPVQGWDFAGGSGEIRTRGRLPVTAFRVRLVMTTSIRFQPAVLFYNIAKHFASVLGYA